MDKRVIEREFLDAAGTGDVAAVSAYVQQGGDVNVTLGEGWTALHSAVSRGQLAVVERLLAGATSNLNALTVVGTSALGIAIRHGNNIIMRMLLDAGASRSTVGTQ